MATTTTTTAAASNITASNNHDLSRCFHLDVTIEPCLLHGDLWSGNISSDKNGEPVILDPACYYGHNEAEFGMSWCAGFGGSFYNAYFEVDLTLHMLLQGGAAVTIALQQLKGLFGIKKFTKKTDVISVMRSVVNSVEHGWNYQTILIGVSFLVFLLVAKYIGKKNKKLFWVPAIAPLISVIVATFCVFITRREGWSPNCCCKYAIGRCNVSMGNVAAQEMENAKCCRCVVSKIEHFLIFSYG